MLAYLIGDVLPWDYLSHDGTTSLFLRDRHFIGKADICRVWSGNCVIYMRDQA